MGYRGDEDAKDFFVKKSSALPKNFIKKEWLWVFRNHSFFIL